MLPPIKKSLIQSFQYLRKPSDCRLNQVGKTTQSFDQSYPRKKKERGILQLQRIMIDKRRSRSFQFAWIFIVILINVSQSEAQTSFGPYGIVPPTCTQSFDGRIEVLLSTLASTVSGNSSLNIPCGTKLVIDAGETFEIPGGLLVEGHAEVENKDSSSETVLITPWILVKGHFRVGQAEVPYLGKLKVLLTDSSTPLSVVYPDTRFADYSIFGKKAFVVYGGSVQIHSPDDGPTHALLSRTVVQGDSRVHVNKDLVNIWNQGETIAVAHTAMVWGSEDEAYIGSISKLRKKAGDNSLIFVKPHFRKIHTVRHIEIQQPGQIEYDVDMAPEVVRLSRRVIITGSADSVLALPAWYKSGSVGATFVIAHTDLPQHIEGVEFSAMGLEGVWGSFPISVRFCGTGAAVRIKRNSIHHSKSRCVVVTASDNVIVEENVSFRTAGHCFVVEDGLEKGNVFDGNVALAVRPALQKISDMDISTENDPCGFWFASADNSLRNNVVGGARGCGYWYELYGRARGISKRLQLPGWDTYEIQRGPLRQFDNNLAHSTYSGVKTHALWATERATIKGLVAWGVGVGWQAGWSSNQVLTGASIVDVFYRGVNAQSIERTRIENSILTGELYSDWACTRDEESSGIWIESLQHFDTWSYRMGGVEIENVHFQDFIKTRNCKRNYAIKILVGRENYWFPSASYLSRATFLDVDYPMTVVYSTENHLQFGFELRDKSLPGFGNGYLVSTGFESAAVATQGCESAEIVFPETVFCPGQCWRHISLAWSSPESVSRLLLREDESEPLSFTPQVINRWVEYLPGKWRKYTRLTTVLIPAGQYDLTLLGANGRSIDAVIYGNSSFLYIQTDVRDGSSTCNEVVDVKVHGVRIDKVY